MDPITRIVSTDNSVAELERIAVQYVEHLSTVQKVAHPNKALALCSCEECRTFVSVCTEARAMSLAHDMARTVHAEKLLAETMRDIVTSIDVAFDRGRKFDPDRDGDLHP